MSKVKESDWKLCRSMLEVLRESYLSKNNLAIAKMLTDPDKSATEQFWECLERMQAEKKKLQECLDGFSRSTMWMKTLSMYRYGIMTDEDLSRFSEELQQSIREHNAFLTGNS